MNDDLPWFKHYNEARNHPKMRALRGQYGAAGYGLFWMLNEIISQAKNARLDLSKKINRLSVAEELGFKESDFLDFLTFLSDPEIDLINFSEGIVTTDQTQEDFAVVEGGRLRKRGMGKGSAEKRENSAEERHNAAEKINRAEQSRAEENREEQQASTCAREGAGPPEDARSPAFDFSEIAEELRQAGIVYSKIDLIRIVERLGGLGVDGGFVAYVLERARSTKPGSLGGLVKKALLEYDWHLEYLAKHQADTPEPSLPAAPDCEFCGGEVIPHPDLDKGTRVCVRCGQQYSWDAAFEIWILNKAESLNSS